MQEKNHAVRPLRNDLPALAFLGPFPKMAVVEHNQEKKICTGKDGQIIQKFFFF